MRRVHVIPCGYEEDDKGVLTLMKDCGKMTKIPCHAYLIEDPEFTILVDTGLSIRWRQLHPATMQSSHIHLEEYEYLDRALDLLGFSPMDMDCVVNTHLHYDHCGNNAMFPKAAFLVSEAELAHAFAPGWWEAPNYVRSLFDVPGLKYEVVRGNVEVRPGVRIISTPGHSDGHQSVAVQLEKAGLVVLAGDALFIRENLEGPTLPGIYTDASKYARSVVKLKHLVDRRRAILVLSHSREYLTPNGWKQMREGLESFT
jgi:glyoxylase-like metal-dependent hydrolase (beta-lactamase superfamily II)